MGPSEVSNSDFYHSRPSVLVMASSSTNQSQTNPVANCYDTITLHKVQEEEGEVISSSGLYPYFPAQKILKLEEPTYCNFEYNQYEACKFTSSTYKYNELTQDNHSRS